MAMRELSKLISDRDNEEEVWVAHYSSNHQILLVGEGDFSFSHSLAISFGSASNICASSLDSYDDVVRKYKKARSNLKTLKRLGAFLLHGVDATKLQFHPDLRFRRFDRVIFNFPHAGFHSRESDSYLIQKHRELVFGFFHCASHMLRADGQIHVSHKNKAPFCHWNLEELASRCFLVLIQCAAFEKSKYPGYENKRGDGSRCDQPFLLGDCSTFKFRFSRVAKELYADKVKWRQVEERKSKHHPFQTEFQGIRERQGYCLDHNLRQVEDPLGQSRQRTYPLHLSYYQEERRCSQFEDASIRAYCLDHNLRQVEDPLDQSRQRTYPLHLSYYQEERRCSQFEDAYIRAIQRPVSFSLERNHVLFCQDFTSQTNHHREEQFHECSNRFNGVSHGIYNREGQSLRRQSNHNFNTIEHW